MWNWETPYKRDVHKRPVCNGGWRYGCFGSEDSKERSSDNLWRNAVAKASYGCLLEHFIVYDISRFNLILHIWYLYWCIIDMHFAWDSRLILYSFEGFSINLRTFATTFRLLKEWIKEDVQYYIDLLVFSGLFYYVDLVSDVNTLYIFYENGQCLFWIFPKDDTLCAFSKP